MKSEKRVVLVTTIFNRERYIKPCIESALKSTLDKKHWVHLLIDNCSTDNAGNIAKEYCDKHEHMYFIQNDTNVGQMPAYNKGLDWIKENFYNASYITMLDSDDLIAKAGLETCFNLFESEPRIEISYSGFHVIDSKGRVLIKNHAKSHRCVPKEIELTSQGQRMYRRLQLGPKGNKMTHLRFIRLSSFFSKVKRFNEDKVFSTDFNIYMDSLDKGMVLARADGGKNDKGVLYLWRDHGKRKRGIINQVEKDHSAEQHSQWQELSKFYKNKWKKEGRI